MNSRVSRLGLLVLCLSWDALQAQDEGENFITHGAILGRLSSDGVGIWARTARTGAFTVRYGDAPDRLYHAVDVPTLLEHDNTGWTRLSGLEPNRRTYYELGIPGSAGSYGREGSFRTLPDSRRRVDETLNPRGLFNFSFEYACGNNQNPAHSGGPELPAFTTMLEKLRDRIHFAILNGDWLYEARRAHRVDQWAAAVDLGERELPKVLRVAPTLVGVWENYKHFLSQGVSMARWHREIPSFFTYDDHEVLNDVWGAGTPGLRDRRAVFRDIGVRAWYDYLGWSNPTSFSQRVRFGQARLREGSDILVDPDATFTQLDLTQASNLHFHWGTETAGVNDNSLDGVGGDSNAGVYRIVEILDRTRLRIQPAARQEGVVSYSIGRRSYYRFRVSNCEFFVLDTRGQRQMHDTRDPNKKDLSILGPIQRDWLMRSQTESDADFLFVVSSVNLMIPHVGGGKVRAENKDDAWTVFFDEREKLIEFWNGLGKPVCVLTGDLHNSFAIKITDNVWEFGSGPHNSDNHIAQDEGNRPANGSFKYGPREVEIRWSTHFLPDIPRTELKHPTFCVVQVNNVYNNPLKLGEERWVAFPRPQLIFQFYDGKTGELRYAESILAQRP